MADQPNQLRPESVVVAAGRPNRVPDGPVNQPVVLASTYHAGGPRAYGRQGSDTTAAFETAIGTLEGGRAVAFASGMAATSAIVEGLPVGAVVVLPTSFYNYHRTLFDKQVELGRLSLRPVDITDTDATMAALDGAAVLWLELPTNPLLAVPDLPALACAASQHSVLSVVDATLATPLAIRPLKHGADVVMHSATKWIAGHSDLVMGVLITADDARADRLVDQRNLTGAIPGSLECYLALRGLRTLAVRLDRACANAAVLAERLAEHPAVRAVHHLGRADHPQAERVARLLANHGGLLSFELDSVARADRLCERLQLITHATSLGGVESLIERRGSYPGEAAQGTPAALVRLSTGIEHVEDLWADLAGALA
ncbi:MAG TPA: PLP-dependent aspartate aminotransferase family protein [Jatrophihabitans sp.]|nr:PLP-dependent aspartate aminotransferase family protein [Jatrophihabitans sp.]